MILDKGKHHGGKIQSQNKCLLLGGEYREKYVHILKNDNKECHGKWCVDGTFSCAKVDPECYQVEHIVDRKTLRMNIANLIF